MSYGNAVNASRDVISQANYAKVCGFLYELTLTKKTLDLQFINREFFMLLLLLLFLKSHRSPIVVGFVVEVV